MVVERYRSARGVQPVGAVAALGMSAALVGGLILSSPSVQRTVGTILIGENIPLAPPTPEPPPEAQPQPRARAQPQPRTVDVVSPLVESPADKPFTTTAIPGSDAGTGLYPLDTILPPVATPTPAPVLTGPSVDPRYARDLQPLYPAGEQRAGREGLVSVRVLVGTDGRVLKVERVSAASDAFFAATERQALGKWRFRPATQNGVAVEAWRTMTVRFVLPD